MTVREKVSVQGLTVLSSTVTQNATGATALVLEVAEGPPLGFFLTLETIAQLRRDLAIAEAALWQPVGNG